MGSAQPCSVSSRNPLSKHRRLTAGIGAVSATTRPPWRAAKLLASSFWAMTSRCRPLAKITFQLSGRSAATDMSASSWYTSVSKRSMVGMNSSATAGLDRSTEHSSISSAVEA